ncbi:hypothetical protein pb186bvf_014212 [Paramecium bursaria]
MLNTLKNFSLQTIKEIDQFGALLRPTIQVNTREYKTFLGGLISITIYGLSFIYFIYGMVQWQTGQILPVIVNYDQVLDSVNYTIGSDSIIQFKNRYDPNQKINPFNKSSLILMAIQYKFTNGLPPYNNTNQIERINYVNETLEIMKLKMEKNSTYENAYYILFTDCIPFYLKTDEQCASNQTKELFWKQNNILNYRFRFQQYNTISRSLTWIQKDFFVAYNTEQTYYNQIYLKTTETQSDQGILFPNEYNYLFSSDMSQTSQSLSIKTFTSLFGMNAYLLFGIHMDSLQTQQNIKYPNISQVLADIGSIVSLILLLSYIAIIFNQRSLENKVKDDIIKSHFPEMNQIETKKTWYGKILEVTNLETNQKYDIKQYEQFYAKLLSIIEQKLCYANLIFSQSILQLGIQRLIDKNELIKIRDNGMRITLKPVEVLSQEEIEPFNFRNANQITPLEREHESRQELNQDKNNEIQQDSTNDIVKQKNDPPVQDNMQADVEVIKILPQPVIPNDMIQGEFDENDFGSINNYRSGLVWGLKSNITAQQYQQSLLTAQNPYWMKGNKLDGFKLLAINKYNCEQNVSASIQYGFYEISNSREEFLCNFSVKFYIINQMNVRSTEAWADEGILFLKIQEYVSYRVTLNFTGIEQRYLLLSFYQYLPIWFLRFRWICFRLLNKSIIGSIVSRRDYQPFGAPEHQCDKKLVRQDFRGEQSQNKPNL